MEQTTNRNGITPDEVLAITRLRQWSADRALLRASKTTDYQRTGWQARNHRQCDARLVRVIDFERALAHLPEDEQAVLLLVYREKQSHSDAAVALHFSTRKVQYMLPRARRNLANILDRLDLL